LLLALGLVPPGAQRAHAQPAPPAVLLTGDVPDAAKRARVVVILPIKNDIVTPEDLFAPDVVRPSAALPAVIEATLHRLLALQPYVEVRGVAAVRQELADDLRNQPIARSAQHQYRVGLEQYLGLATGPAAVSLQRASELYRSVYYDLVDAKPVFDAQLMYGVALHDLGRAADSHIALKDAFLLQPDRRFRPSFFPPQVNTALVNALVDYRSSADPLQPYGDNQRLRALATRLGAAALVLGSVRPGTEGPELHLAVYGTQRRVIEAELRVPAQGSNARIDAFLTRWLACAPVTVSQPVRGGRRELRLDTSGSYALYLRQPTRKSFHSLGFAAGVARDLAPGLEWFGRVNMYTSLSDPYRDLLHAFNSVRVMGGVGFTWRRGPLRLYARPGADVHVLGSFIASRDPDCKLFGVDHRRCDPATVSDLDQRILMGGHLALGGHVHIGRNFFFLLQGSGSVYFLPLAGTERLNFPLSAELGLGYRL